MKKMFLVLMLLALNVALAQDELVPMPENAGMVLLDYAQDETSNINTKKMRKSAQIDTAIEKEQELQSKTPRFKFDQKAVLHQRALDYSTNKANTMMPIGY